MNTPLGAGDDLEERMAVVGADMRRMLESEGAKLEWPQVSGEGDGPM